MGVCMILARLQSGRKDDWDFSNPLVKQIQITKYRQTDMLELALRNTNTCAQLQPHNLGPCNKSLQCGKYQLDFKPSRAFSIISSYIQSFVQREVIDEEFTPGHN